MQFVLSPNFLLVPKTLQTKGGKRHSFANWDCFKCPVLQGQILSGWLEKFWNCGKAASWILEFRIRERLLAATRRAGRSGFTSSALPALPGGLPRPGLAPGSAPTARRARGPGSQAPSAPPAEAPPRRLLPSSVTRLRSPLSSPGPGADPASGAAPAPPGPGPTPAPAQRAAAGLAPGDGGGSPPARGSGGARARARARPGERAGRAGEGAARRGRRAGGPTERRRRRRHGRGHRQGLRAPGSPPGPARSRRAAAAAPAAGGQAVPAPGATCLGPSVRRGGGGGARRAGRSGARRAGARRDASGRRSPRAAPRRAAPQPVPPARVPGPLPHRAGARGHADGARMPHRGRELRRAGAHHLGPRPPLLPLLGRLLGECLRPGGDGAPGDRGLLSSRTAPRAPSLGGERSRPSCCSAGCSSKLRAE